MKRAQADWDAQLPHAPNTLCVRQCGALCASPCALPKSEMLITSLGHSIKSLQRSDDMAEVYSSFNELAVCHTEPVETAAFRATAATPLARAF